MEENNKIMWSKYLKIAITILTAIATALGIHSCV